MDIIKIIGIGLTSLIIIIILKQYKPEFALYVSILSGRTYSIFSSGQAYCNCWFTKQFITESQY